MGCLNNKVESEKLPTYQETVQMEENTPPQDRPKSIAFQIPNNQIKVKRGKPSRLNKQLYIIREVSNMNHQLVQSPLKQPNINEEKVEIIPERQQLQFQQVKIKQRKRTRTSKDISSGSDRNEEPNQSRNKTVNFIPQEPQLQQDNETPIKHNARDGQNRSHRSDNRSRLSNRYSDEIQGDSSKKKKRKGSLSLDGASDHTYHSIHFKRAKTYHAEDELAHPTKSISKNKGETDAVSAPICTVAISSNTNFEAEIHKIIQQQGQQSPNLLELYYGLSLALERKGELEASLSANSKYLRLARKLSGVDSCRYGAGLSNLSSIYYSLQNYEKAIQNSMKAKSIRSYAAIQSDMHKARVLNEIGLIQLEQNHLKQATHYLQEVGQIHAKVVKEFQLNLQDMAPQGNFPSKNQYYDKSVQSMEVALKICIRVFGENHLQTANHLDDLGTSYSDAGNYNASLECFQRCFSIFRRMRLSKHKDFEVHTKHFFYNLQVIKLSPNCQPEIYAKVTKILEDYFPENELISDFRSKMGGTRRVISNHD